MKTNKITFTVARKTLGFSLVLALTVAGLFRLESALADAYPLPSEFVVANGYAARNTSVPAIPAICPGPGLLISELYTNPEGNDSPFEFVELRATRAINFAATPYSVVFNNNGTATADGWIRGASVTYGFSITTGSVNTGDIVYVGGSSMAPTGVKLRTINTATTGGDGFGAAAAGGVLGNGGNNSDGVAVFDVAIGSITNATVPIDAIFFGAVHGSAVVSNGASGYQLPVNDNYGGGKLQSGSFIAVDPGNLSLAATGTFNLADCTFTNARSWAAAAISDNTSSVTLTAPAGTPTITENTASTLLNLPATGGGNASGVINDPTDPARTLGIDFTIDDSDTAVASLTVTATSSNQAVVPAANLNLTGAGATRNLKITPAGVGFSTITVTVSDGANSSSYTITYGASAASANPAATVFHTGRADASTAVAVDADYMFVADDEDQSLRLYNRNVSGLPISAVNVTASLGLTDFDGGVPREVDIEASARIGNRIYWLASHSNAASGNNRPNRSRLFATDITGAGAASTLSYVGRYDGLKTDLINWDSTNAHGLGANFFGLAASAATGVVPETPDGSGFNIEGFAIAPDGTTGYVAFRAPIVPATARTRALIVPVTNLAALVAGNPSAGPATFGAPIQLNLGGRGIREIRKNAANQYLIVAGTAGGAANFALYTWTGSAANQPVLRTADLTGLNPESIVEVPSNLTNAFQVPLLSDNGDDVIYNNGVANKDLPSDQLKKFRRDTVSVAAAPTAGTVSVGGRVANAFGRGVARAKVTITDTASGERRTVFTNAFGFYAFADVAVGRTYLFEIRGKTIGFQPQVVTVNEEIADLNFQAQ